LGSTLIVKKIIGSKYRLKFSGWEHVPVVGTGPDVAILDLYEHVTYQL